MVYWKNTITNDEFEISYNAANGDPTWSANGFMLVFNLEDFVPNVDFPVVYRFFNDITDVFGGYWTYKLPETWLESFLLEDFVWGDIFPWQLKVIFPNWVFPEK
jgi:hypothetical protein